MHIIRRLAMIILPVALFIPGITNAAVVMPALDIALFEGDSGAVLTGTSPENFVLDIDATAFAIVFDATPSINVTNQSFTLHATFDSSTSYFVGDFAVAGGLLAGTFDNLTLEILGSGSLDFKTDLTYTSGSLMGGLTGGRLEGIGSTSDLGAKLGSITVVPVPAAVWLFGSGLIGLIGVARRKA